MNVDVLVFSRDRAAQLDLALASLYRNAAGLIGDVQVLWRASDEVYAKGYSLCAERYPRLSFAEERDFAADTQALVDRMRSEYAMFMMDDAVFYRSFARKTTPGVMLAVDPTILCVSLRLGQHTGDCYPLSRLQGLPIFRAFDDALLWDWRTGDADFGYPGSLDAHVFRKDDLDFAMTVGSWSNPNTLEDALVRSCTLSPRTHMACYHESHVVGIPVNRVNETHLGNRYGDAHFESERMLNTDFLAGRRLSLKTVDPKRVTGAHTEFKLVWDAP